MERANLEGAMNSAPLANAYQVQLRTFCSWGVIPDPDPGSREPLPLLDPRSCGDDWHKRRRQVHITLDNVRPGQLA